jgi:hypothetical protein
LGGRDRFLLDVCDLVDCVISRGATLRSQKGPRRSERGQYPLAGTVLNGVEIFEVS